MKKNVCIFVPSFKILALLIISSKDIREKSNFTILDFCKYLLSYMYKSNFDTIRALFEDLAGDLI